MALLSPSKTGLWYWLLLAWVISAFHVSSFWSPDWHLRTLPFCAGSDFKKAWQGLVYDEQAACQVHSLVVGHYRFLKKAACGWPGVILHGSGNTTKKWRIIARISGWSPAFFVPLAGPISHPGLSTDGGYHFPVANSGTLLLFHPLYGSYQEFG